MKSAIKWIVTGCLLAGAMCTGTHEKKIHFKKKICVTKAVAKKTSAVAPSDTYITVWIHGVSIFKPNVYNNGLWPAHTFIENESLFGIGKDLVESDPKRFPADNVLMYSWAGKFDYGECEKASARLYDSLFNAIKEYTAQNRSSPKIRIVTFSYGGNIALNLPKFKAQGKKLVVDELILLAWPVQKSLVSMARDPMFKRIFNVYSPLDIVQIMDPQGLCCFNPNMPLFSSRRIKRAPNVLQAQIHINGRGCGHFGLNNRKFVSVFPLVLDELNDWFCYAQENNLGLKRTRYMLSIYTDKSKHAKHKS